MNHIAKDEDVFLGPVDARPRGRGRVPRDRGSSGIALLEGPAEATRVCSLTSLETRGSRSPQGFPLFGPEVAKVKVCEGSQHVKVCEGV